MSRESSMKFKPASKGDTYDKLSACANCYKDPPNKTPFPVCATCKEASFCSKECQSQAWPLHKTFCKLRQQTVDLMANSPSSPSFPAFPIRKRLLTDFIEVHECSFNSAFSSALILEGGIENFSFDTRALFVLLQYRPDCEENPSVAFSVLGCKWITKDDKLIPKRFPGMQGLSPLNAKLDADARAKVPAYRGMLHVYFRMEDNIVLECYPQVLPTGDVGLLQKTYIDTVDHTKWISRIQRYVRDGVVMRAESPNGMLMHLGRLQMKKGNWVWVKFTKAELLKLGLPPDLPGLLF
ncbi:hypothetical protein C8J57DRAFT_1723506 [Mycena rebaudengoi]|nr:hypothetical protein C8J57DRAFT_1723506 [Mycena rebaudengoi]